MLPLHSLALSAVATESTRDRNPGRCAKRHACSSILVKES
jgi:hypothetical protein